MKIIFFCENFLKFVKSVKNYENSLKKSKKQDFDDFQYQPPLITFYVYANPRNILLHYTTAKIRPNCIYVHTSLWICMYRNIYRYNMKYCWGGSEKRKMFRDLDSIIELFVLYLVFIISVTCLYHCRIFIFVIIVMSSVVIS